MAAMKVNFADVVSCSSVQSIKIQCTSGEPVAKKKTFMFYLKLFLCFTL